MTESSVPHLSQCSCGAAKVPFRGEPLVRLFCHCTICQRFNSKPFADVAVFRAKDVDLPKGNVVEFRTYRPPPAVQRGKCTACGSPAVELVRWPLLPKLTIIPSANFISAALLPAPCIHLFYDRRVANVEDNVPKYSGYWRSQTAATRLIVSSLIRRRTSA